MGKFRWEDLKPTERLKIVHKRKEDGQDKATEKVKEL